MNKLLIATNNQGKVKELQDLLKDTGIVLITPAHINLDLDVIEDGLTYAENAIKKAIAFAQASGLISLADDSGLEVDVLNGAPGLYSARYGSSNGEKLSDKDRRDYLIKNLKDNPVHGQRASMPRLRLPFQTRKRISLKAFVKARSFPKSAGWADLATILFFYYLRWGKRWQSFPWKKKTA